jgi:trimeric autotransporter adhesin
VISPQGIATSVASGSTTVRATSGTISGSTTLTITPAVLVSIAVTPAIPAIPLGTTLQFAATGTYTDGSMQSITGTVQWSSDTPTVATIGGNAPIAGLASSVSQGGATITATSGSVTGSTTLTVTTAALVSVAISPQTPSIALGTAQQFTAMGTFTDGSVQDLSNTVTWTSDTISTASINTAGLSQSLAVGTATVTAATGSLSSSTLLTVTPASLVTIAINPPLATVPMGVTQQFTAAGTFTDGTQQDLTQSGHWSSTAAGVATISNTATTAGLASTLGTGPTTIGISSGPVSSTATLVVNPAALASIAIAPQSPAIPLGTTQQFSATGTYTDGSTQDLTSIATWSSSDAMVAIVSNALGSYGLATSSGQGTATISATSNSIANSTTITVAAPALVSVAISPASAALPLGIGQQLGATGTYSDGSIQDITASVTWASSAPAIAVVSPAGFVTGTMLGSSNVSASQGAVTSSAAVAVIPPILVSLSVAPSISSIAKGISEQFIATGTYSDGSVQNVTGAVNWSSSSTNVVNILSSGVAVGTGVGSASVTATSGSITASATLTVTPPLLTSISVTPNAASVAAGFALQFTATGTYSDGTSQSLTSAATWISSSLGTATVSGGLATSATQGSSTITATSGAISGSAVLTVTPMAAAAI